MRSNLGVFVLRVGDGVNPKLSSSIATTAETARQLSSGAEQRMADIAKYEKRLEKMKRKREEASSEANGQVPADIAKKIEKYEKKLKKARETLEVETLGPLQNHSPPDEENREDSEVPRVLDKSGMTLLLFYAYVEPIWKPAEHAEVMRWAQTTLENYGVTGRLRVSREGFNGTLTGPYDGIRGFTRDMRSYPGGYFADMKDGDDFKYTDNLPIGQAFPKLKVFPVKELVNYGLGLENPPSVKNGAIHLCAKEYHEKLKESNTVVIDVRNTYEADIGRFTPVEGGAVYIDPKMRVSTEFPMWAKENIDSLRDKQVLMYCTGGIRCERASALIRSLGHDNVYQLKGGIHKYLEEFPEGSDSQWSGKNYTFDKRFAHGSAKNKEITSSSQGTSDLDYTERNDQNHRDSDGDEDEDDQFLESKAESVHESAEGTAPTSVLGKCCGCSTPWEKYRGKRRCHICGVPLLLCPQCLTQTEQKFKCTLCKEDEALGRKAFNKKEHYRQVAEEEITVDPVKRQPIVKKKSKSSCGVCSAEFPSRNALFRHLQESGHHNRRAKKKH